jgi:GTPase
MTAIRFERTLIRGAGPQRALLVGIRADRMTRSQMERSLDELARLVDTAGAIVALRSSQEIRRVDPATFLGRGKVEELAELVVDCSADFVAVDGELSPVQNRNLEERLGVLVLDRTAVILDIFAHRARSSAGKLQVELAQLRYLAPRLVGRGKRLSQQAGRIGTRGPGETALEVDRRRIRDRITLVRRNLERVRAHRGLHRERRDAVPVPLVSLVGYTNAGKSTLLNALTDAGAFVEDKLFATLDPTVRRLRLPSGREVLLADTVGFISHLPHELIEAFKSTFEEVAAAELLIHVIDGSDEEAPAQMKVVGQVLSELGLAHTPRIEVINKIDLPASFYRGDRQAIRLAARTGEGAGALLARVDEMLRAELRAITLLLPLARGDILSDIYRVGYVHEVSYGEEGIRVACDLHEKQFGKYRRFVAHGDRV